MSTRDSRRPGVQSQPAPDPRDQIQGTRASQHLDLIRGLAAVAVLIFHVRYRFFLDYSEVSRSALAFGFYTLTSFGHDAVMVFFVLSGFLIGSTVARSHQLGRWHWAEYLTNRTVRLMVVLVPGLLLTMFWDQIGLWWLGDHVIYTGRQSGFVADYFDVRARHGIATFACNALFLQGIRCPPYGSNEALWSLSYEFWYYVIFPLLVTGLVVSQSAIRRVAGVAMGILALYLVGRGIAWYFLIWLLGAAVGWIPRLSWLGNRPWLTVAAPLSAFLVVVAASHLSVVRAWLGGTLWAADVLTGVTFTVCLYLVLHDRRPAVGDLYGAVAARLSACSFTLYVAHLPLLVFLRAWLVGDRPWSPTGAAIAGGALISVVAFGYAALLAQITEAHTSTVRRKVRRWLGW